jgi:hypothetical protein
MAIEREDLLAPFGIGVWTPSTLIIPRNLTEAMPEGSERWSGSTIEERKAVARRRISAYRGNSSSEAVLTISLPRRVGSALLYKELAEDLADIGITLERVGPGKKSDLKLVDRLARYGDPRWFLNQFSCRLKEGLCVSATDTIVAESLNEADPEVRARLYAEAERELLQSNIYIPIGAPIRWSLVRGGVDGFSANPWGLHPLLPMAFRPI